jgi:hypothetical protein
VTTPASQRVQFSVEKSILFKSQISAQARHTLTYTTTPFTFFHVIAGTALTGCHVLVHDMWGISKTSLAQAQITIASFVRS